MSQVVLPESSFLSAEIRAVLVRAREFQRELAAIETACAVLESVDRSEIPAIRQRLARTFYETSAYRDVRDRYAVTLTPQLIGGVYTEAFTPADAIASKNLQRVLINLHGGAFETGSRTASHLESIPIASIGRIKVISIDYRLAPEHTFPAASEDVTTVYRELLKVYPPKNIGIYGCSAGALLTAQALAWFQREDLPAPGAISLSCAAGSYYGEGDSGHFFSAHTGHALALVADPKGHAYFKKTDPSDPLAFPVRSEKLLSKFPPSLLLTSTRDQALSSVAHMHSRLIALGVKADLHVWEGLDHAFSYFAVLPQARDSYRITVKFFDDHLGW